MRLNRQLSVLFNRNRSNFSYLTLFLLFQSARHPHPPGQWDRTSCNATQRGGSQIRDPPGKKKETTRSLTAAPAPHYYTRPSSRSAFAKAAAISFFDRCQGPGCEHPRCNDEGISRCGRTRRVFLPGGARSARLRPRYCWESPSSSF